MIRRPPRSTQSRSSAASDVYKRQVQRLSETKIRNTHLDSIACKDFPGFQGRAKHRPQRNNGDITPFRHKSTSPGNHGRALTNLFTEVVGDVLGIPDSKWPGGSN